MPQTVDPHADRLGPAYRQGLRELLAHYEIEVLSCVYWRNRAPWFLETRQCFDSFFLFPIRGSLRLTTAAGRSRIGPGHYLALPDGVPHALHLEKGHVRLEQIALHCRILDRWGRPLLSRFPHPVAALADPARWYRALTDLASLMSTDPELGRHWGKTLTLELMAGRLRQEAGLPPLDRQGDPRIERVLQRMKAGLADPALSIESLARGVDLTATQVRKLFRRETRVAPKNFLLRLRLEKAVHLLRHSTLTIKQIAFECGFATDNYFHLVFRKAFGSTPSAFRQGQRL